MYRVKNSWDNYIGEEFQKDYFLKLSEFLTKEYDEKTIFPPKNYVFRALKDTDFDSVKVVILGQDPYHGMGQAHGLCFSVSKGIELPPSLKNIFKEISCEFDCKLGKHGDLSGWARQGVLLLNTCLTVRQGVANSHQGKGWEIFTDEVIKSLNKKPTQVVFMLWGANAKSKSSLISNPKHLVLQAAHPSPLSAYNGFFGCEHFKKCNDFLLNNMQTPIDWCNLD